MVFDCKNLSVVIQGNLVRAGSKETPRVGDKIISSNENWCDNKDITKMLISSIRQQMPESKIILSTYEGSDISSLDYDDVVLIKDPGAAGCIFPNQANNTNRIIATSMAGLKLVKTKYVLKIRSDSLIENTKFINIFKKLNKNIDNGFFKIFENKVMANYLSFDSRNAKTRYELFNLNDWFLMGETKTIIDIFNIPSLDINGIDFKDLKSQDKENICECVYVPEQYIFIEYLKKKNKLKSNSLIKNTFINRFFSHMFLANNFIFINSLEHGISHKKHESVEFIKNEFGKLKKVRMSYNKFCYYNKAYTSKLNLLNLVKFIVQKKDV